MQMGAIRASPYLAGALCWIADGDLGRVRLSIEGLRHVFLREQEGTDVH